VGCTTYEREYSEVLKEIRRQAGKLAESEKHT
jgi:hypothetical protein